MNEILIHCKNCEQNIPIKEFDVPHHDYGYCKPKTKEDLELDEWWTKQPWHIRHLFSLAGIISASIVSGIFALLSILLGIWTP